MAAHRLLTHSSTSEAATGENKARKHGSYSREEFQLYSARLARCLCRSAQPAIQKLAAASFPLRRLGDCGGGVEPLSVVRYQRVFVVPDGRCVLPQITGSEDSARQLIELLVFDSTQKPRADLSALDNLLDRNACPFSKSRQIQFKYALPVRRRGCGGGVRVHDASP